MIIFSGSSAPVETHPVFPVGGDWMNYPGMERVPLSYKEFRKFSMCQVNSPDDLSDHISSRHKLRRFSAEELRLRWMAAREA
jgi:ribosomal protein L20A (L18A)